MYQRPLSIAILAFGGFATASGAWALGFGRIPDSIPFGQALDLSVPLRLDAGESLTPACVQAEVHIGEQRLGTGALALTLERSGASGDEWRIRLRSAQVVQEPLVAVNLSVGCSGSIARQFVVFADPPAASVGVVPVAAEPPATATVAPAAVETRQPTRVVGAATAPSASPKKAVRKTARKTQTEAARAQANARPAAATARRETPKPAAMAAVPRLKLEEPEELLRAATLAVAAQDAALATAAQAASAAQAAASAAEQRLLALESDLKTMRADAAAHRAAMDQLRTRLAQTEDQGRMQALLVVLVVLLGVLALWLGWKVRTLARERQAAWWQAAAQASSADAAVTPADTLPPAPLPVNRDAAAPDATSVPVPARAAEPDSPVSRTAVLPPAALVEDALTRPVSVDELIDLEQQAEFFVVLGEEDAAVDLLMSHLRSSGGTSPLPYLKLLEIYRRRGEREAYERMRKRFGQRFNAVAPQWDADPEQGRDLQDYPAVLATLQATWSEPLDAMAELENLLFRKRSGELFDLPAYRDVLTLFSVARDLHRHDAQPMPDVDVLLPLAAGGELSLSPASSIFDSLSPGGVDPDEVQEDRPTAPVDLDLSEAPVSQDSVVGELSPVRATLRQGY
jgi:pilus assembly protein FimV